jgi:hypothetical protein
MKMALATKESQRISLKTIKLVSEK